MNKNRYIDDEAAHSGDDVSVGSSDNDESLSDHESFIDHDEHLEDSLDHANVPEEAFQKNGVPKRKLSEILKVSEDDAKELNKNLKRKASQNSSPAEKKPKLMSNKTIPESSIPPKPIDFEKKKSFTKSSSSLTGSSGKKFIFRLSFTNGAMFHKFLLPIASAVTELRFNLTATSEFNGLRLEAHDTYLTLANKSRFECDVDCGDLPNEKISEIYFCVAASSFMQTLGCATLKDTVLMITKYADSPDKMTFESITNESDVQTVYDCDLLAESRLESLKGMQFNLGYHVNLYMKTLKEQTTNAKKCGAATIYFELFQAIDNEDSSIVHSRLSLGFKGTSTSGSHDFYQSAKKIEDGENTEWQPLAGQNLMERSKLKMERKSYNEYDNSKLRLFFNHMVRLF